MKLLLSSLLVLTVILSYLAFRHRDTAAVADQPTKRIEPNVERAPTSTPAPVTDPVAISPVIVKAKPVNQPRNDLSAMIPDISQAELERRAAKVEQETNHELSRLVKLLDLTEEQQDQVFAALAENAPDYHPAMNLATSDLRPLSLPTASSLTGNSNYFNGSGRTSQEVAIPSPIISGTAGPNTSGATGPTPQTTPTAAPAPSAAPYSSPINVDIPGSTPSISKSPIELLLEPYLTGPQQNALTEEESDRTAWWAEWATNLANDLPTPAIDVVAPPDVISTSYNDDQ